MTVNQVLEAIAAKLELAFPGQPVHFGDIPSGAEGQNWVRCIGQSHKKQLGRRRTRTYAFDVCRFRADKDKPAFYDWAEQMYAAFETLDISGQTVHTRNAHAEDGDPGVFRFLFEISVSWLSAPEPGDQMQELKTTEVVRN